MADVTLIVRILTDAKDAAKGVAEATQGYKGFNDTMKSLAAPAGVALGAVVALGAGALNSASELQQSMGSVEAVFGSNAQTIMNWSKTAASSVGLAQSEYQNFASVIGAQLKNLGVPMDQVAGNTNDLISLGADLAATYGGTTQQAVEALSSALRGEADPAEKYGLALNQTAVNGYLAAQGLTGLEGAALTSAKAQAVMALATEQAGGALGQFDREADTVAGQQQRLNASWEDASAALGQSLLPIITPVVSALAELANWVAQNASWITPLVAAVGALAAIVVVYTAAQWALNAAMSANPIAIIVIAIAALVAGFIALWNSNEEFRNGFIAVWEGIMAFFQGVGDFFVSVWNAVVSWLTAAITNVGAFFGSVFSTIGQVVQNVANFFQSVWQVAVQLVQAYIQGWVSIITAIFNAIRGIVQGVASFFASAWQNAVNAVTSVFNFLRNIALSVFNAIQGAISGVVGFFNSIVDAVKNVINWIGKIKIPDIFGAIGGFFGGGGGARSASFAAPAAGTFAAFGGRSLALAAPAPVAMGGGGTTINVQGGLDSADTIARRIQSLLTARDRRAHGVTITRSAR